jgi:hypothetical protein
MRRRTRQGGQGSRGKAGHPRWLPASRPDTRRCHHPFGVTAGRARTISKVRAGHGQRGLRPPHASLRPRERLARPSIHCNAGMRLIHCEETGTSAARSSPLPRLYLRQTFYGFRPSSRAATARRSFFGGRRPLSREEGIKYLR